MYVRIVWKTKDTKPGKMHVRSRTNDNKQLTVSEATKYYKNQIEEIATEAYLQSFNGWHWAHHKILKNLPIEGEAVSPCWVCDKIWKRKDAKFWLFFDNKVVCKTHPGATEWYEGAIKLSKAKYLFEENQNEM